MPTSYLPTPQLTDSGSSLAAPTTQTTFRNSQDNLYFVAMSQFGAAGNPLAASQPALCIWKSVDSGFSWTLIVTDSNRSGDNGFSVSMYQDVLLICIPNANASPTDHLGMFRYDTISNTFLADDYAGPGAYTGALVWLGQTVTSDGTVWIAYMSPTVGIAYAEPAFVSWKAGIWGAPVLIGDGTYQITPQWMIKEQTSDRMHLFLYEGDPVSGHEPAGIWHISVESTGSLNSLQNLVASTPLLNADNESGPIGQACIMGTDQQIDCPYVLGTVVGGPNTINPATSQLRCLRGTVEANPTWTDELLLDAGAIPNFDIMVFTSEGHCQSSAIPQGAGLTIVFGASSANTFPSLWESNLYTIHTDLLVEGWSFPALLYSGPYLGGGSNNSPWLTTVNTISLTDNSFGVVIGSFATRPLPTDYATVRLASVFVLPLVLSGTAPPGKVGQPYSFTPTVTGGTTPYAFTLTAGSLPPGLILNSTTGMIGGIPTTPGTYPFTLTVTGGGSASAAFSIAICSTNAQGV